MNEIEVTRKYLKTLKQVYVEDGLARAIKHDIVSTVESIMGKLGVVLHYSVFGLDTMHGLYSQDSKSTTHDFRKMREDSTRAITNRHLVSPL